MRGCRNVTGSNGLLPVLDYNDLGGGLGMVTGLYGVRHGLVCRLTERACTAWMYVSRNIPVRARYGVVKRRSIGAARVCTGVAGRGRGRSVGVLSDHVRGYCRLPGSSIPRSFNGGRCCGWGRYCVFMFRSRGFWVRPVGVYV